MPVAVALLLTEDVLLFVLSSLVVSIPYAVMHWVIRNTPAMINAISFFFILFPPKVSKIYCTVYDTVACPLIFDLNIIVLTAPEWEDP